MGRYSNRFQAGGSNAVGATYTAAAGGGNSKFAVVANGQVLSRSQYPALASFYGEQSQFAAVDVINSNLGTAIAPTSAEQHYVDNRPSNCLVAAEGSGFTVFAQPIQNRNQYNNYQASGIAVWYTQDGNNWKLATTITGRGQNYFGIKSVNNKIFLLSSSGLYRSDDGLNYSLVYNGRVSGIASDGTNYILCSGGTGVLRTSDFQSFTGIDIPQTGVIGYYPVNEVVFYSGNYYGFGEGYNGVVFSTDSGATWNIATSGLANGAGLMKSAAVLNGYLIVNTQGPEFFQYTTNPTGTVNTWTTSTRSGYPEPITHWYYESGNYIFSTLRGTTNNYAYAYILTGIAHTGIVYSATNDAFDGFNSQYQSVNFSTVVSGTRSFYIGSHAQYIPTGANWSGTTTISTPSTSGVFPNPFFRPGEAEQIIGTTNSGNSYIIKKQNRSSSFTFASYLSAFVEVSGYFKRLQNSASPWAVNFTGFQQNPNVYTRGGAIIECSGKYMMGYIARANNSPVLSGMLYNTYSQSTFTSASTGVLEANVFANPREDDFKFGPASNGLYLINISGHTSYSQNPSTGYFYPVDATTGKVFSFGAIQNGLGSGTGSTLFAQYTNYQFSLYDEEVFIAGIGSGSLNGFSDVIGITIKNGVVTSSKLLGNGVTLIGGATNLAQTNSEIVRFDSDIYLRSSATIYKHDPNRNVFLQIYAIPNNTWSTQSESFVTGYTQIRIDKNTVFGFHLYTDWNNYLNITPLLVSGASVTGAISAPHYFKVPNINGDFYNIQYAPLQSATRSTVSLRSRLGATGFVVPNVYMSYVSGSTIPSGVSTYIIAR